MRGAFACSWRNSLDSKRGGAETRFVRSISGRGCLSIRSLPFPFLSLSLAQNGFRRPQGRRPSPFYAAFFLSLPLPPLWRTEHSRPSSFPLKTPPSNLLLRSSSARWPLTFVR